MASRPAHLYVLLHGEPIGTLTRVGSDRTFFAFTEEYVQNRARPTLSLGFKSESGELMTEFPGKQLRLLPYFSNLLPEGHLRTYLADRAGVDPDREFLVLAVVGEDLPGAVQAVPEEGLPASELASGEPPSAEPPLRFSLAGVELKFSALHEAAGGLTIPASGAGGSWIVKLPSQRYPNVPENEYSMLTLASRIGIDTPEIDLTTIDSVGNLPAVNLGGETSALALRRFDRSPSGERIHMEDFAQVFGVYPERKYRSGSYRNVGEVIAAETPDDIPEFVRRLTFCALIGNADLHLKNWSLVYPDRVRARLSPAYDLISTVLYIQDAQAALRFSRTRRFDAFDEDELRHLAARAGLPETLTLHTAQETVDRFHAEWKRAKRELPVSRDLATAVERQAATVPIFRR